MKKIKEIIVVEGKDDISKVKSAFDCDVIATNGTHFSKNLLKKLKEANEKCGIIVFTDPDYAGEKIRKNINRVIPNCKNAFLSRSLALKGDNIGVENAKVEDIIEAIENAKVTVLERKDEIDLTLLTSLGISGMGNSKEFREKLCDYFKIGYCNSKQFVNRLNSFGITESELILAVKKILGEEVWNGFI